MVEPKQKPAGKPVHTADQARIPRTAMRAAWLRTREGTSQILAEDRRDGQYQDAADQEDDFQSGDLMADAYFNGEKMWEFWPKVDITDETGFSAIPAGYFSAGDFHGIYERAVFWVTPDAGEEPEDQAPVKCLYMDNPEIQTFLTDKGSFRASVRCVREH